MTINPRLLDPSRTGLLRRRLEKEITSRMRRLQREVTKLIVTDDVFGLQEPKPPTFNLRAASTQFNVIDPVVITAIQHIQNLLDPKDVLKLEDQPHITVRFGLDDIGSDRVSHILGQHHQLQVALKGLSLFENEKEDVLKIDVSGQQLQDLYHHLGILPNQTTHPEYKPHLTIAYLKRGTGRKYVDLGGELFGRELVFDVVQYSDVNKRRTGILLDNASACGAGAPGSPGFQRGNTCGGGFKLGYSTGDGGFVDVPSAEDAFKLIASRDSAVSAFEDAGIDVRGMTDIKIVLVDDPRKAGAFATGSGFTHKHHLQSTYESVFKDSIESRSKGAVPGFAMQSVEDLMIHEIGHNIGRKLSKKDNRELERLYKSKGTNVDDLPSFYAQENSSEMYAESVLAIVRGYKFGGTSQEYGRQDPEIENFVRKTLKLPVRDVIGNQITTNTVWRFLTRDQQLDEFTAWLRAQMAITVLAKMQTLGQSDPDHWLTQHIERTFKDSMGRVFDTLKKPEFQENLDWYKGTKEQFLLSAFGRPPSVERVKMLTSRAFNELQGVTDQMATQMQRTLTDSFISGDSPFTMARKLNKDVEGIGIKRARTIARTETLRAHNSGALEGMENLGVEEIGVAVEWSTSGLGVTKRGYPSPCKLCAPLQGIVLTLAEAKKITLPRHANCMCSWTPANVGESTKGQLRTRERIRGALDRSVKAERSKKFKGTLKQLKGRSKWAGSKAQVDKDRPKSIL